MSDPPGVSMLGVGFDRGGDQHTPQLYQGPDINPFLNLQPMATGVMTRGFALSTRAVTLGIAPAATSAFHRVGLSPGAEVASGMRDWVAPTACFTVMSPGATPVCGSVLLDTGLGYAIVQAPAAAQPPVAQPPATGSTDAPTRPDLQSGLQVAVTLSDGTTIYSFTVGHTDAPQSVQWGHNLAAHGGTPFMNISRYALSGTDYFYDATHGQVGFLPHTSINPTTPASPDRRPSLAATGTTAPTLTLTLTGLALLVSGAVVIAVAWTRRRRSTPST